MAIRLELSDDDAELVVTVLENAAKRCQEERKVRRIANAVATTLKASKDRYLVGGLY